MSASPPSTTPHANITDFLRRLAGIMGGGGNATLLEQAAVIIESLTERAMIAEQAWRDQADEHARELALRGTAERAYDVVHAKVVELQTELAESNRLADSERNFFAEETGRLQQAASDAEARLRLANAELGELRTSGNWQAELTALQAQLEENNRLAENERTSHAEEAQRLRSTADEADAALKAAHAERDELRKTAGASEDLRAELAALQTQFDESKRFADSERGVFADEARRLRGLADDAETRLKAANAERDELRGAAERASEDRSAEITALHAQLAERDQAAESERTARTEEMQRLRGIADDAEARLKTIIAELGELREAARTSESPNPESAAEIVALQTQLAERERLAETERAAQAEETQGLRRVAETAEARLKAANAELEELRSSMTAIDQSIAVVPVTSLELARTQFTVLAEDFAKTGDVISQTICEIGACAIDKALTGSLPPENTVSPLVKELLS
jgi:chromosome segregation ATPase